MDFTLSDIVTMTSGMKISQLVQILLGETCRHDETISLHFLRKD
jgi:hypothetical protein